MAEAMEPKDTKVPFQRGADIPTPGQLKACIVEFNSPGPAWQKQHGNVEFKACQWALEYGI